MYRNLLALLAVAGFLALTSHAKPLADSKDSPVIAEISEVLSIDDLLPGDFPPLGDLPDNTRNTTSNVKVVNGTRIQTNTTIAKFKDEDGNAGEVFHIVRITSELEDPSTESEEGVSSSTPVPTSTTKEGVSTSTPVPTSTTKEGVSTSTPVPTSTTKDRK